ncbi:hypothetical protein D9O50_15390 [Oxalobacteraceae bacterium CAVE-383]|nr:hypothetical protein D9O50_15390 [Oxalobacteraceae bacterium CAVE-383]
MRNWGATFQKIFGSIAGFLLAILVFMGPNAAEGQTVAGANARDDYFSEHDLQYGKSIAKDECAALQNAVWMETRLGNECIRYYPSTGLEAAESPEHATVAVLYFHGDHLAGNNPIGNYAKISPQSLTRLMEANYKKYKVPFILIGRPGVYGSSGEHKQRRRMKESLTLNAAVDAIKARYGLTQVVLAGQSGGAYTVAALLTLGRTDVKCAAASSGVYAVAELAEIKRARDHLRSHAGCDVTDYCDQYEVIDHVDGIAQDPHRMFYVIGNPNDRNTVFSLQKKFAEKVLAGGHQLQIIEAEGLGPEGHGLAHVAYRVAGQCAAL